MTVALGVSAYSAAVFHLMTHAFFKALLFLGAGSVIIGMHHDQDMRNMGGLWKYMPITWFTSLVGSLALIGFPFFSGFYSKDTIIEAVALSHHSWGWLCILLCNCRCVRDRVLFIPDVLPGVPRGGAVRQGRCKP
jgi:NADH:ubiquinone oxidoreductase subunit 5 (subunit L)/multisubunit Na+/H+ antiporter MnhA subunit